MVEKEEAGFGLAGSFRSFSVFPPALPLIFWWPSSSSAGACTIQRHCLCPGGPHWLHFIVIVIGQRHP